jgi:membrane protein YdbS with pleckstrin-like domain
MSSESDATERYSRVAADLDWSIILASASSIFFGFLLNIAVNSPSYFRFLDNVILLAALYAVTVATAMFIMPVIHHMGRYRQFDVERFVFKTKEYVLIGIICIMVAMYLGLGLALNSKVPDWIAYSLASFPFIFIFFQLFRYMRESSDSDDEKTSTNLIKSSSTEDYDRVGGSLRWSQILA